MFNSGKPSRNTTGHFFVYKGIRDRQLFNILLRKWAAGKTTFLYCWHRFTFGEMFILKEISGTNWSKENLLGTFYGCYHSLSIADGRLKRLDNVLFGTNVSV